MKADIDAHNVSAMYKGAVATAQEMTTWTEENYRAKLWEDYQFTLKTFKEELESDFNAAKESYDLTTAPYKDHADLLKDDVFKFFLYEGYITPKYAKLPGSSRDDKTKILSFENASVANGKTKEQAIMHVYNDNVTTNLHEILSTWGTAGTLATKYAADATTILLHTELGDETSGMKFPNIEGIVSLGHTSEVGTVKVNGKDYTVAHEHNEDGSPKNANEYDVLQISLNGKDPKAIFNFGFTVAPAHYYSADEEHPNGRTIDIKNNQFGVEWASSDFQSRTIQSQIHSEIPVGAGPFKATNSKYEESPKGDEFWSSGIVYFKRNDNFMFDVKAEKLSMQVVSSTDALDALKKGSVDYVTPQFTKENSETLKGMASDGFVQLSSWQLGYGYIGINAGKVENINIRRAIMSAMETNLATQFYEVGTCKTIAWPMSMESWAYPFAEDGKTSKPNPQKYARWEGKEAAVSKIQEYMSAANVSAGDSQLDITFTIAGASITEHPTYNVFKQAAELLNEAGWDVEVKADSQALTKLSTGSLEVWAAAWGSSVDPDMYQVYHKNSLATSVYAWGYREIKANTTKYAEENRIINDLSDIIDDARSVIERTERTPKYEEAMKLVLELAVELPVYQRQTLYAYNSNTVKGFPSQDKVDAYNSPLAKIWELELVK